MIMPDFERLDSLLDHIEAHPERHQQRNWLTKLSCGTGGCLAGLAVLREYPDGEPALTPKTQWIVDRTRDGGGQNWGIINFDAVQVRHRLYAVAEEAQRLLGLNTDQAEALFAADNTTADLRALRHLIAAHPGADEGVLLRLREEARDETFRANTVPVAEAVGA
jgi:hypothetical protein